MNDIAFILIMIIIIVLGSSMISHVLRKTVNKQNKAFASKLASAHKQPHNQAGYYSIDIAAQEIFIQFGEKGMSEAKHLYQLERAVEDHAPVNNRYKIYNFDFGDSFDENEEKEQTRPLKIYLNYRTLKFQDTYSMRIGQRDEEIIDCQFQQAWSPKNASLEQAFSDFKHNIQWLYAQGAQIFHGLTEIRYAKSEHARVLVEEGYCIAPELLSFDEFRKEMQQENSYGIDICFYLDEVTIDLCYNADYQVEYTITLMNNIDSHMSYVGMADVDFAVLTLQEKKQKFIELLNQCEQERRDLESEAKKNGYAIDEAYQDPYVTELLQQQ